MNTGFNLKSPAALYMRAQSLSCECLFVTPWTTAHLAPLSMGFSSQEYWSGLPISSSRASSWPRDRTHDSCVSCTGRQIFLPPSHLGSPTSWISPWLKRVSLSFEARHWLLLSCYGSPRWHLLPKEGCFNFTENLLCTIATFINYLSWIICCSFLHSTCSFTLNFYAMYGDSFFP